MDLKQQYEEKGIIVIPDVFTAEECAEIKRQAYSVTDNEIVRAGYRHAPSEMSYGSKALIFFPALAYPDYLIDGKVVDRMNPQMIP